MNKFHAATLCLHLHTIYVKRERLACRVSSEGGGTVSLGTTDDVRDILGDIAEFCKKVSFQTSEELFKVNVKKLEGKNEDLSSLVAILEQCSLVLERDIFYKKFLFVEADRTEYLDTPQLFGPSVHSAFPSARQDILDSGNCLAAECCTAAVFHLMRVAEHGLRALAKDRRVTLPKGPLDLATWETIIQEIEKAETAIQGYPKTLAREAQMEFYHGAQMEFKRFKNKFRNRVMHTRDEYDRNEALSALEHVRDFMKILSSKISETKMTPLIWKGSKWTK